MPEDAMKPSKVDWEKTVESFLKLKDETDMTVKSMEELKELLEQGIVYQDDSGNLIFDGNEACLLYTSPSPRDS